MAKVHVADTLHLAADTAIQLQGARGYSKDTVAEWIYRYARQARLVDGASEVHEMVIAAALARAGPGVLELSFAQDPARLHALANWLAHRLGKPSLRIVEVQPLAGGAIQENWRLTCRLDQSPEAETRRLRPATQRCRDDRLQPQPRCGVRAARAPPMPPVSWCRRRSATVTTPSSWATASRSSPWSRASASGRGSSRTAASAAIATRLPLASGASWHASTPSGRISRPCGSSALRRHPRRRRRSTRCARLSTSSAPSVRPWSGACAGRSCTRPTARAACWSTTTIAPATTWSTGTASRRSSIGSSPAGATPWPISAGSAPNAGASAAPIWRRAGSRRAPNFYRGYEAGGGRIDDAAVRYWETVAHLRWAVIALEQGERHASGRQRSLELALTGRIVPELELAIVRSTGPAAWRFAHAA